jgi:hypothetical protein
MIVCNFCSSEFPTEQSLLYHQKHTKYCISIQYLSTRLHESIHNIFQQLETKITQLTYKLDELKVKYDQLEEHTNQQITDLKLLLYTQLPNESQRDTQTSSNDNNLRKEGEILSREEILAIGFKRFQKSFCEINPYIRVYISRIFCDYIFR